MFSDRPHAVVINAAKIYPPRELERLSQFATVSVITEAQYAHRYGSVSDVHMVDSVYRFDQVRDAARAIYERQGIDCVIGPAERSIPVAGLVRTWFGVPGFGFDVGMRCSNKQLMKQALHAAGLPVTGWTSAESLERLPAAFDRLGGGPVVVKPVFGGGSKNTFVLHTRDEAVALGSQERAKGLRDAGFPLIVEQYVDISTEYHCDGVVHEGKVLFSGVSHYLVPPLQEQFGAVAGSMALEPQSPEYAAIQELHRRAVGALGLDAGVTHLEVLRRGDDLLIGEIACRPGGDGVTDLVRWQHGVDLWQAFTDISAGRVPVVEPVTDPRTVVLVDLPLRSGRVTAISRESDFRVLPEVLEVESFVAVGDTIGDFRRGTAAIRVFLAVERPGQAEALIGRLMEIFVLETV
ncbi:ATP-grasp domain-containing protein [Kineosporia sp. J2-2]|uniref:ATP-grasp domain-containing protein n=1 Tax=Kineosporia corallincola TaxID=2835133 RepID=A0ABS5TR91_9ACTN|nr:ATP-grasp domain-containing protein [Kineosporia corallincola]MBT0773338.1 ATP-grasp domain-containing protein [Kineosporia corallincola]